LPSVIILNYFEYRNILKFVELFVACGIPGCRFFVKTLYVFGNLDCGFSIVFGENEEKSPSKSVEFVNNNWHLVLMPSALASTLKVLLQW
jgi:hypothetical protein